MKLLTLDELGATNKAGCEALLKKYAAIITMNRSVPDHDGTCWSRGNTHLTTLQNRYQRFIQGKYSHGVDTCERALETLEIAVANNGGDARSGDCTQEAWNRFNELSIKLSELKDYLRFTDNSYYDVRSTICDLYETGGTDFAVSLAESYDMTIYTCKSCNNWHILKNDADPSCPDCEYSLDEVL